MGMFQLKPSFAAGELTPALMGRTDLQKYDVGAARIENALVLRYGGVMRRPGFYHVQQTANNAKARLLPFRYNVDQHYILEFTPGRIRFYTDGGIVTNQGAVYSITSPYGAADLDKIKYVQSADTLFLTHPNYPPYTLVRNGAGNWSINKMDILEGPFEDPNTNDNLKISASATTGTITLTASQSYFAADMAGSLIRLGHTVKSSYIKGVPDCLTHTADPEGTVRKAPGQFTVECPPKGTVHVQSFGFWDGSFTLERYDTGTASWVAVRTQEGARSGNYEFTATNESTELVNYRITSTGFNIDVWTQSNENERQRGFITIQTFSKDYYGMAKITAVTSGTSATATVVKKLGAITATNDFSLQSWSRTKGYPACVGFFEDRLVFAGSKSHPQTYWASKSGDYWNFGVSIPTVDDDAIIGSLSSGQMNGIKAIVTFAEMLMLTSGGEYKVGGGQAAFTPSNQQAKAQEYRGINDLTPVIVGSRVIYVQHQGSIIRDLAYSYDVDKYTGDDVSLLASHLFDGHEIVSITYQQTPNSIVWCVRDDGVLLGMTYIKEQDVFAWHRHTTEGKFIDVCSISGEDEDELWAVVLRDGKYYVELMASQISDAEPETQFYVDAGYSYSGEPVNTLTGLAWLAGKAVQVLADGNVIQGLTVGADGAILFGRGFSHIQIGLEYDTTLKTMPIELQAGDGTWGSRKKRIQQMCIMFKDTRGGWYGVTENKLDEIKWRATERYGDPITLFTGKKYAVLPQANYSDTIYVTIKQKDPLPMKILSIIPEVTPGG